MCNYNKLCELCAVMHQPQPLYYGGASWVYPDFTAEKIQKLELLIIDYVGFLRIDHTNKIPNKMPEHFTYNVFCKNFEISSKNYTGTTRSEALSLLALKLIESGGLLKENVRKILE